MKSDLKQLTAVSYEVLCEICVKPRLSESPRQGERHPKEVQLEDAIVIIAWAVCQVAAGGGEAELNG